MLFFVRHYFCLFCLFSIMNISFCPTNFKNISLTVVRLRDVNFFVLQTTFSRIDSVILLFFVNFLVSFE